MGCCSSKPEVKTGVKTAKDAENCSPNILSGLVKAQFNDSLDVVIPLEQTFKLGSVLLEDPTTHRYGVLCSITDLLDPSNKANKTFTKLLQAARDSPGKQAGSQITIDTKMSLNDAAKMFFGGLDTVKKALGGSNSTAVDVSIFVGDTYLQYYNEFDLHGLTLDVSPGGLASRNFAVKDDVYIIHVIQQIRKVTELSIEVTKDCKLDLSAALKEDVEVPLEGGLKVFHSRTRAAEKFLIKSTQADKCGKALPFGIAIGCLELRFDLEGNLLTSNPVQDVHLAGDRASAQKGSRDATHI